MNAQNVSDWLIYIIFIPGIIFGNLIDVGYLYNKAITFINHLFLIRPYDLTLKI